MPQLERGVSTVVSGLTAGYVAKCKLPGSDLERSKTSLHTTSHVGLEVTTVFMSIWPSLTCLEMCCILNTWQILICCYFCHVFQKILFSKKIFKT